MKTGELLTLAIDRPAAGGRMIARHDGAIVFVADAIPGETVEARVERVQRGTGWARTVRVLQPSADRLEVTSGWSCGGNVLAHVAYQRQLAIKRDIIRDALTRIGKMAAPATIDVAPSPVAGYRMRARLHRVDGRLGFFREGTHQLCDAASSGQLLDETIEVVRALERWLAVEGDTTVAEVEIAENCAGDERALHLAVRNGSISPQLRQMPPLAHVRGVSCGPAPGERPLVLWGVPEVTDAVTAGDGTVSLKRHAHAFFQGNRHLLNGLITAVVDEVPEGGVVDLYAGVGVFSIPLAARGRNRVLAVEGDHVSAADLRENAAPFGTAVEARHESVEGFLGARRAMSIATVIVDPPRTGMTRDALAGTLALGASRLVYVSCDVATFARDARLLVDSGYRLTRLRAFDLFPQTAHVETLAVFDQVEGAPPAEG